MRSKPPYFPMRSVSGGVLWKTPTELQLGTAAHRFEPPSLRRTAIPDNVVGRRDRDPAGIRRRSSRNEDCIETRCPRLEATPARRAAAAFPQNIRLTSTMSAIYALAATVDSRPQEHFQAGRAILPNDFAFALA